MRSRNSRAWTIKFGSFEKFGIETSEAVRQQLTGDEMRESWILSTLRPY
jgi:hypothetical protein